ncbi:MAG: hypothetical protein WC956_06475 [bacterium]
MTKLEYGETPEFSHLMKRLTRRFRSLPEDLETVKKAAIELLHVQGIDNKSCYKLQGHENQRCEFYKVKKFACKALKGKGIQSGIRLIYAYHRDQGLIVFIEIYYKGDQKNESLTLIEKYLSRIA